MAQFNGRILIIGCGGVAQCSIQLILRANLFAPKNISIIDPNDYRKEIANIIDLGVQFNQEGITKHNYEQLLARYLKAGDVCIDLANQVDTNDVLSWCQRNAVMYLNTCLNYWPTTEQVTVIDLYKKIENLATIYKKGPTAVISHGANPGLISSFVKQALVDFAHHLITTGANTKDLERALDRKQFNEIAHASGVKTIHLTEKDSQRIAEKVHANEIVNTWSIVEFINEATSYVEFPWGTHEKQIPAHAKLNDGDITLSIKAYQSAVQSWIPYESFTGMIMPHDEAFTVADLLSIKDQQTVTYRPTTLFIYEPSPAARESLYKITHLQIVNPERHIIKNEIIDGADKMGCLLITPSCAWWTGSILTIQESNRLAPNQNATVMQVAAGVIAALAFMINNQRNGICFPEELPYQEILAIAKPYLGTFLSESVENKNLTYNFIQHQS